MAIFNSLAKQQWSIPKLLDIDAEYLLVILVTGLNMTLSNKSYSFNICKIPKSETTNPSTFKFLMLLMIFSN